MIKFKIDTKYDLKKLDKLVNDLNSDYYIKVGIIGDKTNRNSNDSTNAEIGFIHEFGSVTKKIPARSFLRMPLFTKSQDIIKDAGNWMRIAIKQDKFTKIKTLKQIGKICENYIREAFSSGGFGKWAPLSQKTIDNKRGANKNKILVDTMQLRDAITSEISNK